MLKLLAIEGIKKGCYNATREDYSVKYSIPGDNSNPIRANSLKALKFTLPFIPLFSIRINCGAPINAIVDLPQALIIVVLSVVATESLMITVGIFSIGMQLM